MAAGSVAQTVDNPRLVTFTPSADHDATNATGTPVVTDYVFQVYTIGASAPFHSIGLGKPAPAGNGLIYYDFSGTLAGWPLPGAGTYEARVAAVGPDGTSRSAASNPFTLSVTPSCAFVVGPSSASVPSNGGTASVAVTVADGCVWTASAGAGWLSVSPASGSGARSVIVTAPPNTGTTSRSGPVTVAGAVVPVTQDAAALACSYVVSPTSVSIASGASATVSVTAPVGCAWAASGFAWAAVSPSIATGSGSAMVVTEPNTTTAPRTATVTVAGHAVVVTEAPAAVCSYAVSPASAATGAPGGTLTLTVSTDAGCPWTATTDAAWLTLSMAAGSGAGTIFATASANGGGQRASTMMVAGQSIRVTQAQGSGVVNVSSEPQLQDAIRTASPNTAIVLAAGTYRLTQGLQLQGASNVTLRGATGNRDDVLLIGPGLQVASDVGAASAIRATITGFVMRDLTIRDFPGSAVIFAAGAEAPRLANVHLLDAGQAFVRADPDGSGGGVDGGLVEGSTFEYTGTGRDASSSGIVLQGANSWIVRDSLFRNVRGPSGVQGGPAVIAWNRSANTLVERNTFVNCQRPIVLGASPQAPNDHSAGIVRNNFVYRAGTEELGGPGVSIGDSPSTRVLHNTILLSGTSGASIEYRWSDTTGVVIADNLTDAPTWQRDGAAGTEVGNFTAATQAFFVNAAVGNLHLVPGATVAIDGATPVADVLDDWDGDPRPRGAGPDIGADEIAINARPTVALTSPAPGTTLAAPANVTLAATAGDLDGVVRRVAFYANGTPLGTDATAPYALDWSGLAAGSYTITAIATDDAGAIATSTPVTLAVTAVASGSAAFLRADTTTQGNWRAGYGQEGYVLVNDGTSLPAYAHVTPGGASWWTWAASTADTRALAQASGADRLAATWYSPASFTIDVDLADGAAHDVALYAVDWDAKGRAQAIDVRDAGTGALLDAQALGGFAGGQYLVWRVRGHVTFRVTRSAGDNAVVSAVFLGGAATATFVATDTATHGNWRGAYGSEGYALANSATSLPAALRATPVGEASWAWAARTTDARALQQPAGADRIAATWYSPGTFDLDVDLADGATHQVALYAVDWDDKGRAQTVDLCDATTGAVLDSRTFSGFRAGQYLVWRVRGHVVLRVTRTAGDNAVVSAVLVDPAR